MPQLFPWGDKREVKWDVKEVPRGLEIGIFFNEPPGWETIIMMGVCVAFGALALFIIICHIIDELATLGYFKMWPHFRVQEIGSNASKEALELFLGQRNFISYKRVLRVPIESDVENGAFLQISM